MTAVQAAAALAIGLVAAGCLGIGEPTHVPLRVAWTAHPDTVAVGREFSFEMAGPVSLDGCARLDTVTVTPEAGQIRVAGRRSLFHTWCPGSRVSFYQARALRLGRAGRWPVRDAEGRLLGSIVAVEGARTGPLYTRGEGTLRRAGGCVLFGPGWIGNQRVFALRGLPDSVLAAAGSDRLVRVVGPLAGFRECGAFGSRPAIRVDSARVTSRDAADYYHD